MTSHDWYHHKAAHLVKVSDLLRDPTERKKLFELSLGYLALARYVAKRQHRPEQHSNDA